MEISEAVNTQFVFPGIVVGLVLVCAALVFVFGFKTVEDFPFDKIAQVAEDRKSAGKKRKVKDKKPQLNGQAAVVSETKTKVLETTAIKPAVTKIKLSEKTPVKDVTKLVAKHEKKTANTELTRVPLKPALKDVKNIKESNKQLLDEAQKLTKGNEVQNREKNQKASKQSKRKGKENVESKNKKNLNKSKNIVDEKLEEDEGAWEQAYSRKDKKKKPATSDEENMVGKTAKSEVASPEKKNKSKQTGLESSSLPLQETVVAPADVQKDTKEKPLKKEKESKKTKPKPVEEVPVVETVAVNMENDGESKTAKKKKKKTGAKENAEVPIVKAEENFVSKEVPVAVASPKAKHAEEPAEAKGPVFDELGDSFVEPKSQRKSNRKKVRKE